MPTESADATHLWGFGGEGELRDYWHCSRCLVTVSVSRGAAPPTDTCGGWQPLRKDAVPTRCPHCDTPTDHVGTCPYVVDFSDFEPVKDLRLIVIDFPGPSVRMGRVVGCRFIPEPHPRPRLSIL